MLLLIVFFSLITWAFSNSFVCKDHKMDYIQESKKQEKTMRGCFKASKNPQFVSEDCHLKEECSIIKKIKGEKWKVPMPYPVQGSPHFMACYQIGGIPSIVTITADKRRKFALCHLNDSSFVDAYTLMFHVDKTMKRLKRAEKKKPGRPEKSFKLKI